MIGLGLGGVGLGAAVRIACGVDEDYERLRKLTAAPPLPPACSSPAAGSAIAMMLHAGASEAKNKAKTEAK